MMRKSRLIRLLCITVILCFVAVASCGGPGFPDQTAFRPLSKLRETEEACVRVYGAPIPYLRRFAIHTWFVVKRARSYELHRWEVWQEAGGPYGHVQRDLLDPEQDVGAGGTHVIAELRGEMAEKVARFIETQSPRYPWRHEYTYFPGPNSNTYTAWVLNKAAWQTPLPWTAAGKNWLHP